MIQPAPVLEGLDVFICYAHEDEKEKDRLLTQLAGLRRRKVIRTWHDRRIRAGQDWDEVIRQQLDSCQMALLLVSPFFLDSDYVQSKELKVLLERRARKEVEVIPIIVRPANWEEEPAFSEIQALPRDGKAITRFTEENGERDEAWVDVARQIALVAKEKMGLGGEPEDVTPKIEPVAQAVPPAKTEPETSAGGREVQRVEAHELVTNDSEIRSSIDQVVDRVRHGNVTIFIGQGATESADVCVPSSEEVSSKLFEMLQVVEDSPVSLPFDLSANYFAVKETETSLENQVGDLLSLGSAHEAPIYAALAQLIQSLNERRSGSRSFNREPQLIVSTNLDVLLECALLCAGIPFTRVVQFRGANRLVVNEYSELNALADGRIQVRSPRGAETTFDPADQAEITRTIRDHDYQNIDARIRTSESGPVNPVVALDLHQVTEPIIYKYLGSLDVPSSCTMSIDQSYDFMWWKLKRESIPRAISTIIGNSTMVFLGSGILDPDFRLCFHTLLREPAELNANEHYMVCRPLPHEASPWTRRIEQKFWKSITKNALMKYKLNLLQTRNRDFLTAVTEKLQEGET